MATTQTSLKASDVFKIGDRVRVSAKGNASGFRKNSTQTGVVVGWSTKIPRCMRVWIDGTARVSAESYSWFLWELDDRAPSERAKCEVEEFVRAEHWRAPKREVEPGRLEHQPRGTFYWRGRNRRNIPGG